MMNIKLRLIFMNFLHYFVWGSWLISMGKYMIVTLHFTGGEVASVYGTMGIASLFMPGLLGILADQDCSYMPLPSTTIQPSISLCCSMPVSICPALR
jgi:hypothetical protein